MEGMHQTSTIVEVDGVYYWFDAGESCGYRAFLSGVDVLKTRAIFLSHMHSDHIGGLPHLLFCMQKMIRMNKGTVINDNKVDIFAPDLDVLGAVKSVTCANLTDHSGLRFDTKDTLTHDGLLYEDEAIRVSAIHNTHLREDGSRGWHAYSFLIEVAGKRIVHSGDVGKIEELLPFMEAGCDLLVMETGHHKVRDICDFAHIHGVERLRLTHHGREIIHDRAGMEALVASYPHDYQIAYDGMVEVI